MNRKQRARLAEQTVRILQEGCYVASNGGVVHIGAQLQRAVDDTWLYTPESPPPRPGLGERAARFSLANETTLQAARRLATEGAQVMALNFASAKHPGGGFLGGSEAQEESLARASGLYACLEGSPYYDFHRAQHDARYSHHMIYSPGVPVFRDEDGSLLDHPWSCAFLTAPAVNRGAVEKHAPHHVGSIGGVMRERIARILAAAVAHGHDAVVLGAFGCGVFRNRPAEVADLFMQVLLGKLSGAFERVHFAVLDTGDGRTYDAFAGAVPNAEVPDP